MSGNTKETRHGSQSDYFNALKVKKKLEIYLLFLLIINDVKCFMVTRTVGTCIVKIMHSTDK